GYYNVAFKADNLSSGVYFYKIQVNNFSEVKKMMLLR
ncbi:MAG: T9SS type A sorting domain-containing protein, partial [Ignavibacterium sp.]|nr:T9SS type A sorting domain-containing protein [Ignavibacterium sp.]